jgi:beta-glucosidase
VESTGEVYDTGRIEYLRAHLLEARRAIREGANLQGYFTWSLMDNFEWAEGYSQRFGLIHIDYETLKRTPKWSYHWYRDVIARNGLEE